MRENKRECGEECCCCVSQMEAELVVVNQNMAFHAEALISCWRWWASEWWRLAAQHKVAAQDLEDGGGSRNDTGGARCLSEKYFKRVKDFGSQNWRNWNLHFKVMLKNACPQMFHLVTKMERTVSRQRGWISPRRKPSC